MAMHRPEITVGSVEGGLYVSAAGRATQRVCPTADQVVSDYLGTCQQDARIFVDLAGCDWLDSTFAGWLSGLRKRLARVPGGSLTLVGCSGRCRASLDKMQLGEMFDYGAARPPQDVRTVPCATTDRPDRDALELMAKAHEELADVSPENRQVFGPIAEMLRARLQNL